MFNYVQEQDVSFTGVKINASENRSVWLDVGSMGRPQLGHCQLSTQVSYLWPVDFQSKTINYKNR